MTQILELANSVAASKEDIRQAIVSRGSSCDVSVPLEDYARIIRNMTVSGSVDNLQVKNYSGGPIKAGDKVIIMPDRLTQATIDQNRITTSTGQTNSWLCPDGNIFMRNTSDYSYFTFIDWNTVKDLMMTDTYYWKRYVNSYHTVYDKYGQLWVFAYNISYFDAIFNLGYTHLGSNYSLDTGATSYSNNVSAGTLSYIYEYDVDNRISKTFSFYLPQNSTPTSTYGCVVGNKIFLKFNSGNVFWSNIPQNDGDSIIFTDTTNGSDFWPIGITSDNKYLIGHSNSKIVFRDISNNPETFGVAKTFENTDLSMLASSSCYITYNPCNEILCLHKESLQNNNSDLGMFKYNSTTEEWDTITPDLTDFYANSTLSSSYDIGNITISNDMSRFAFGRSVFSLPYTNSGGYVIVPMSLRGNDSNMMTAIALEDCSGLAGSTCNVKTILP